MENKLEKLQNWYRELPDKKKYLEFVTALLSVPVMATVILLNVNSLTQRNAAKQPDAVTPTPAPTTIVETLQPANMMERESSSVSSASSSAAPTTPTPAVCKDKVGPVNIATPQENQVIDGTSVCITINYQQDGFCDVVWSYSLDAGSWTDYSHNDICLYNLSGGTHVLNVRVKSTKSDDQITLRRTFINSTPTPLLSPTQAASSAAAPQ